MFRTIWNQSLIQFRTRILHLQKIYFTLSGVLQIVTIIFEEIFIFWFDFIVQKKRDDL